MSDLQHTIEQTLLGQEPAVSSKNQKFYDQTQSAIDILFPKKTITADDMLPAPQLEKWALHGLKYGTKPLKLAQKVDLEVSAYNAQQLIGCTVIGCDVTIAAMGPTTLTLRFATPDGGEASMSVNVPQLNVTYEPQPLMAMLEPAPTFGVDWGKVEEKVLGMKPVTYPLPIASVGDTHVEKIEDLLLPSL